MIEYHKIQSVYLRDPANRHKTFLEGQWSLPEFGTMTHEEAKGANKILGQQYATIAGERFPLVTCNNEGAFLEDKQGREFFAYWHEIAETQPDSRFRDTTIQGHPVPENAR